jgi:hypothetical protein
MNYAGRMNEFDRVARAMAMTGMILDAGGLDQKA